MKFKKDSVPFGFVIGLIGPWLGMVIYYFAQFSHLSMKEFANFLIKNHAVQSPMLSLSLIVNLAVYYFFYHYNCDKTTKGILLATFVYAPIVVYLKIR